MRIKSVESQQAEADIKDYRFCFLLSDPCNKAEWVGGSLSYYLMTSFPQSSYNIPSLMVLTDLSSQTSFPFCPPNQMICHPLTLLNYRPFYFLAFPIQPTEISCLANQILLKQINVSALDAS